MITRFGILFLASSLFACGGTVVFEEGSSGDGGSGGSATTSGPTTSTGTMFAATATATSTGTGTGGGVSSVATSTGSAQGGSSSVSTSDVTTVGPGAGGGSACGSLNYAECLGASDRCVPQFDDFCCPSCFPGGCADCIDYRSVACIDRETGGSPGGDGTPPPGPPPPQCAFPGCGFVPDWACRGDKPFCEKGCFGNPGCVEKVQCQGDGCSIVCDAVAPDACGPVSCDLPPPVCGDGQIAEASGGCWTGACIPLWVCQYSEL